MTDRKNTPDDCPHDMLAARSSIFIHDLTAALAAVFIEEWYALLGEVDDAVTRGGWTQDEVGTEEVFDKHRHAIEEAVVHLAAARNVSLSGDGGLREALGRIYDWSRPEVKMSGDRYGTIGPGTAQRIHEAALDALAATPEADTRAGTGDVSTVTAAWEALWADLFRDHQSWRASFDEHRPAIEAAIRADTRAAEPRGLPLDVAWAEAEAAFGGHEGDWRVLFWPGLEDTYYAEVTMRGSGEDADTSVEFGYGPTPDAALRALLERLAPKPAPIPERAP